MKLRTPKRKRMSLQNCRLITGGGRAFHFTFCTGSDLPSRVTEIAIQFRRAPHLLVFRDQDLSTNTHWC